MIKEEEETIDKIRIILSIHNSITVGHLHDQHAFFFSNSNKKNDIGIHFILCKKDGFS